MTRKRTVYGLLCTVVISGLLSAEIITYPANCYLHNNLGGTVIDITKPPYNADPSGITDCTDALIAAYDFIVNLKKQYGENDIRASTYIIYLPNGTYKVSNTIVYSGPAWVSGNHERITSIRFKGEDKDSTVIQLIDNASGFEAGKEKPVISYGKHTMNNRVSSNFFENITIHTGSGNPGAVGLRFHGANNEAVRDVDIISGDGQGAMGLDVPMGACQGVYRDITVQGFDIGIHATHDLAKSLSFEHITLNNQNTAGFSLAYSTVSIRDLQSTNSVPAVVLTDPDGQMVLIDSDLNGGSADTSAVVIQNGYLFARNVTTSGYASAVQKGASIAVQGPDIDEYHSDQVYSVFEQISTQSLNLPIEEVPQMAWENNHSNWACVNDFGATANDEIDDTNAIRQALNTGKPVVYFLPGIYVIDDSITVPASVEQINFMFSQFQSGSSLASRTDQGGFVISENSAAPLLLEDLHSWFDGNGNHVWFEHACTRTLVLKDMHMQRGKMYRNSVSGGKVFIENCSNRVESSGIPGKIGYSFTGQQVWIRYIDPEYSCPQIKIDGGQVWIFGYKTEGMKSERSHSFEISGGAEVEILNGICNAWGKNSAYDEYLLMNDHSDVSAVFVTNGGSEFFSHIVSESQGSASGTIEANDVPKRSNDHVTVPYYVGYTNASDIDVQEKLPSDYVLHQNYPNPFNGRTVISFESSVFSLVNIEIYNIAGQSVRRLYSGNLDAGLHPFEWDGRNEAGGPVSTGIYVVQLKAHDFIAQKKMLFLE